MRKFISVLVTACAVYSCTPDNPDLNPGPGPSNSNRPLNPFTVTVVNRAPAMATITWTEATNIYNTDTVKYGVVLNGLLVDSNRIQTIDTLRNLSGESAYTGRVYAYTKSGDTASAPFHLEKINGYIVFGDSDGSLVCHNAFSHTILWQTPPTYGVDGFESIPTVVSDVVYANSTTRGIYAFNAKTGAKIWNNDFGYPNSNSTPNFCNPVYHNQKIYTTFRNEVYALNSTNGQVEWNYTSATEDRPSTNPVIGSNLLFLGLHSTYIYGTLKKLIAIDITTHAKVWEYPLDCTISRSPVLYNTSLIIFGGADGKIYALHQSTGKLAWSRDFSVTYHNYGADFISPVIYNDLVIVHNGNHGYYGLNATSGATVWNYAGAPTPNTSSPAIGNGLVYFNVAGTAVALNAATGSLVWEHIFPDRVSFPSPIYAKKRLYFGNNRTYGYGIHVLDASTGKATDFLASGIYQVGPETVVINDSTSYLSDSGMVQ